MDKTKRLRISYSLLNLWERGEIDKAVSLYLHKPLPTTRAMDEGRRIHDEIETFIEYNQKLPDYLSFDFPLVKPQPEAKIVTHYNDRWDLSGVIDNLCQDCFMEFKTGSTPATSYTRRRQIPFYFLLLELDDNPKDKAFLVKYNQHEPSNEIILVWKTQSALDDVRNYIDTLAPEIEDFFRQKSIIT